MSVTRTPYLLLVMVGLLLASVPAHADDPPVESVEVTADDESASFSLGLDAQVRYGFTKPEGSDPVSEFRLRRFRPILGFEAFEYFEAKLVPEFAGEPELKDGVIGWIPTDAFKVEAGQFAPPFNWERDGSSDYHQFTERSVANREFQIADGRDIGVQFDWEWQERLDLEAGIFNGAGSNVGVQPGTGHIATGRLAYAPLGAYHEVEVVPEVIRNPVFMVAVGGYFAFENAWRDWARPGSPARMTDEPIAGNVWSVTADAHLWLWRFSVHTQGFYREVRPCCGGGDAYETYAGAGFTGQAGFLAVDERLLAALRYSMATPDIDRAFETHEMAAALQIFHLGNRSKFTLDAGMIDRKRRAPIERYARLQYQMLL